MNLDLSSTATLFTLAAGAMVGAILFWLISVVASRRHSESENYEAEEEVEGLTVSADPFTQGRYRERRGAARRGGNPIAVLITDESTEAEPIRGYVLDRSTGGLCLSCDAEIEEGTVLSVRTANAPETAPWVQVEVKNCRKAGKEYEIGCQWLRTPPWSVLLLFG
jgi:PilZ domain-containing protein